MKYMFLIYSDPAAEATAKPEEVQAVMQAYYAFGEEAAQAGVMVSGEGLHPVNTATTVRLRNGKTLTTDGPFAETKEVLGGYYILELKDMKEAVQWAAKIPGARVGSVEIRAVQVYD
jgi:hypothetical protein